MRRSQRPIVSEAFTSFGSWTLQKMGQALWPTIWKAIKSKKGISCLNDQIVSVDCFDFKDFMDKAEEADIDYAAGSASDPAINAIYETKLDNESLNKLLFGSPDGLKTKDPKELKGILFNDYWRSYCEFFTGEEELNVIFSDSSNNKEDDDFEDFDDVEESKYISAYREVLLEEDDDFEDFNDEEGGNSENSSSLKVKEATMQLVFNAHGYVYVGGRSDESKLAGAKKLNPNYVEKITIDVKLGFKEADLEPMAIGTFTYRPHRNESMNPPPTFRERMGQVWKRGGTPLDAALLKYAASKLFGGGKFAALFSKTIQEESLDFKREAKADLSNIKADPKSAKGKIQNSLAKKFDAIQEFISDKLDEIPTVNSLGFHIERQNQDTGDFKFSVVFHRKTIFSALFTLKEPK